MIHNYRWIIHKQWADVVDRESYNFSTGSLNIARPKEQIHHLLAKTIGKIIQQRIFNIANNGQKLRVIVFSGWGSFLNRAGNYIDFTVYLPFHTPEKLPTAVIFSIRSETWASVVEQVRSRLLLLREHGVEGNVRVAIAIKSPSADDLKSERFVLPCGRYA